MPLRTFTIEAPTCACCASDPAESPYNLRPGVKYITSWPGSGFSESSMDTMNLLYLSLLSQRVPVLPFFTPTHVKHASTIDFGEVFDIPRLSQAIGHPVLEWWQVKDRDSKVVDPMGCWSIWQAVSSQNKEPHFTSGPQRMHLDISYTVAPTWIKLLPGDEPHARFTSLMALTFPEMRKKSLRTPAKSPILEQQLPPDDQMVCFDNMYWMANTEAHEFFHDYSTAWRFIGANLHFAPRVEELAHQYLREAFTLGPSDPIPPYITIHVRHNDFKNWCRVPIEECFAPLSAFKRRVDEVQAELLDAKGLTVSRVVVTSDEKNSSWWDETAAYGWHHLNHTLTGETYGNWYPLLIDAAIQSAGMGLVGTELSTVSLLAKLRVKAWQGGATRMVKWGKLGADDH
ncbi:hypothetical protein C8F04DRAFT_1211923 [Mycena alexandri]|uniref:Uncharacterized protein n=1 Tax=Mycena alexandri TaxID=1745969 RepID=A0AAD6SKM1_9AGAR|nr:hypothetical protein C8F04DRAFT_1211923 [Mycena alexandri]